ncbi:hypothetical protein AAHA92_06375 [Salvia divinorum]|uniref:Uncharacterized protein n=1 Tax=Salvia divinorum TaxID=28513 RepID=A0ABD1I816_SALDI
MEAIDFPTSLLISALAVPSVTITAGTTPGLSSRRSSSSLLLHPAAAAASRFDSRSNGVLSPLPSRLYRHLQRHGLLLRPNPKISLLVLGVRYFGFKMWNWVCGYLSGIFERIRVMISVVFPLYVSYFLVKFKVRVRIGMAEWHEL